MAGPNEINRSSNSPPLVSPRSPATPSRRRRRKSSDDFMANGLTSPDGGSGRRSNGERRNGSEKKAETLNSKYKKMWTRVQSSVLMIGGFVGIIYMGHVYIWLLIICLQFLMVRELFGLANRAQRHKHPLPGFAILNWHFFLTAMLYVYGRFMYKQLMVSFASGEALPTVRLLGSYFIRYHAFVCYSLYITGFVCFILSLRKGMYQYQFGQFAWSHMILFVVFFQSSFFVYNVFQGIVWFLLPCSLIIINDIAAYFFGFYFGRTPLIKLSPKKTWEGFIGASVTTIISAFLLAGIMGRYEWLTCPRTDMSIGPLHCEPDPMFFAQAVTLPAWLAPHEHETIWIMPFQKHALAFGLFASSIAPFGGFFASGFKRAFKIKDFGDSIPGHGGITDRMDCQMVMAVFSYIYYQSFVAQANTSADYAMSKIMALSEGEILQVYYRLGQLLTTKGFNVHELCSPQ